MNEKSLSDRILGYSFLASVLINIGWIAGVAHSDIFGSAANITELHERPIKVFKPVPVKPKPKEVKPLPPPPPPKQPKMQPKIQPLKPITRVQPRPAPTPVPTHTVAVARSTRSTGPISLPAVPENTGPVTPAVPSPVPTPPAPPVPIPQPPAPQPVPQPPAPVPQPPAPQPVPPPPKPVAVVKPSPPPPPPKPKGWVPIDTQEAAAPASVDVSMDGVTSDSISNPSVVISFVIDGTGHVRNARVSKSCGNSELDQRVLEAIKRARCVPAVQDHIPREQQVTFTYPIDM